MANSAAALTIEALIPAHPPEIVASRREPGGHTLRLTFAGLALVLLLVPLAAAPPLIDPDEGLHAAIAQEMLLQDDYVTPTFLGEPFLDKPILFFWTEMLSLRVFGMNERAVRIPPLVFGFLGMLSVAWLGRHLFGETAGLLAGIAYGSMLLPLGVSQVAVHDIGLVPFLCLAIWCLVRGGESTRPWLWGVPLGLCLGLSVLTKGLVGVVFTGIFAVCLAAAHRDRVLRLGIALSVAGVVALLVAAPWYLDMEHAHPGYLRYYFIQRHLRGYLTATQRHAGRPWWYYLPILAGGALPWTGYLVGAFRARAPQPVGRTMVVVWAWLAVGLVFLSIGESKLVTYVLPLFPGLALAIGEYVARTWRERRVGAPPFAGAFTFAFAVQILVLAVLPALAIVVLRARFGSVSALAWIGAIAVIPVVLIAGIRARRAPVVDSFAAHVALATAACVVALVVFVAPDAVKWMTTKELAEALNASGRLPPRVIVVDERIGSLVFYLEPELRREAEATVDRILVTSRSGTLERLRVDPDDSVVVVRDDDLERFARLFPILPEPDVHAGTLSMFRVARLRTALERSR